MMRTKVLAAALAAATLGLSGCGFHGLYSASLPGGANLGSHPYTVTIQFADVLDLVPQSNVKVNDVAVGKVQSISLKGWIASVKVKVNGNVDLPANARAAVQQTSLLGEKFVALEQPLAEPEGKLKDVGKIPLSSTGTAPEVEEVLGALSLLLNGGGLEQIRTITTELNKALKGNESAVRDLLVQLNDFLGTLDKQKDTITTALANIDTLAATLNKQKQTIIDALDRFPQALTILKDERSKLTTLLQSLARLGSTATGVINATQTNLTTSLKSLAPVLENLSAAGSDLPNALKILLTFPFPLDKTTDFIKGDYANLHLILNLNLRDNLCGIVPTATGLCNAATALAGNSAKTTPLTTGGATRASPPAARRCPQYLAWAGDAAMLKRSTRVQLIIFLVLTLVGVSYVSAKYVGLTEGLFGPKGCTIAADFPDSGGIFTNAEVTYRGVTVGKVGQLKLLDNGVRVNLKLKNCTGPKIPASAIAEVSNRSVIGEQYVNLIPPNSKGPYLSGGQVIPMKRNKLPVATQVLLTNLDNVVRSVDTKKLQITVSRTRQGVQRPGPGTGLAARFDEQPAHLGAKRRCRKRWP